jgi:bifunctional non-homologous end joining protein LigD
MALEDYKRKRDFTRSPEPSGDEARRPQGRGQELFFCVQKHLASHLHYDLRLEWNGVLLSWAVPKGPSLNPKDKRLAMHVEDHPLDYGEFEGVIPEGYGAGIVMLWDRGTWTPEVGDVEVALRKGDLKFQLDGFKLKGSWALIRTRGYGGERGEGRSWLLIKHRDDWAGDVDITTFAPRSVKSDHDLPGILAAEDPDVWRTNRPVMGGATGALLKAIVEEAAAIKAARAAAAKAPAAARRSRPARSPTGAAHPAARRPRRAPKPRTRPASSRPSPKRRTKR